MLAGHGPAGVEQDVVLVEFGCRGRGALGCAEPGGSEHALTLRDHKDTVLLREKFQSHKKITVIGGGFIGLEVAASAIKERIA